MNDFDKISPLNPVFLNIIGIYFVIIFLLCIFFNSTLLLIFIRHSELRIRLNIIIITITIFNLLGSTVFPVLINSTFNHKWSSTKNGCVLTGFVIFFTACTNVFLMAFISVERYYILKYPTRLKCLNKRKVTMYIVVSITLGFFWSSAPLLGWSHYSLEDSFTSCSVEWKERSLNVTSYNVLIFIFVFVVPFGLIISANIKSILIVRSRLRNASSRIIYDYKFQKLLNVQKRITIIMVIYIAGFVITWIPYGIVSLYSAFINPDHITPLGSTLPAIFAKSSVVWSTLLFIFTNKNIKSKLTRELIFHSKTREIWF